MSLPLKDRVAAVAEDIATKENRFSGIEPHYLAEALGIDDFKNPGASLRWSFTRYAEIVSVEEYAESHDPASEVVYFIQNDVTPERFEELLALSEPLDNQDKPQFSFLTKDERSHLEKAAAEEKLKDASENGMNCIANISVKTESGVGLEFEANVEDDGTCINLRTPYDEAKGGFVDLTNCVIAIVGTFIAVPIALLTFSPAARARPSGGWLRNDSVPRPDGRSIRRLTAFRTQSIAGLGWQLAPFVPFLLRPRPTR
jgi:hypothetical protein